MTLAAKFDKKSVVAKKQLPNDHVYTSDDADKYCNACIKMVGDADQYENFPKRNRKKVSHKTILNFNIHF